MRVVCLVLICAILLTTGQVLWKIGLQRIGGFNPKPGVIISSFVSLCLSPFVIAGVIVYVLATVIWLNILSNAPLSLVYPMMSISYVMGVIVAAALFREQVPCTRWLGTAVVCGGIYLISIK